VISLFDKLTSFDALRGHLLYDFKSPDQLAKAVTELWRGFTSQRDKIESYLSDSRLVSAYAAFYALTNMAKLPHLLERAQINLEELSCHRFIDYGSGPGTFSFAWALLCQKKNIPFSDYLVIDKSLLMLEQAKKLADYFELSKEAFSYLQPTQFHVSKTERKKNILFFGHSFNEMGVTKTINVIEEIQPELIIFLEPGTSDVFFELRILIDKLVNQQAVQTQKPWVISYPCPSALSCPMTKGNHPENWCHQYMKTPLEGFLKSISQQTGLDRHFPASVGFVLKRQKFLENQFPSQQKRIVRYYGETKFSFNFQVCSQSENENEIQLYDEVLLKKNFSKQDQKKLAQKLPGELL
jgi:ribosomal protein RSM22 (predicted rRNA methylase)